MRAASFILPRYSTHTVLLPIVRCLVLLFSAILFTPSLPFMGSGFLEAQVRGDGGFTIARLKYKGGGDWYGNATSLKNLMNALKERANILVASEKEPVVEVLDDSLFKYPFLFMSGHGTVKFTQKEAERLRSYLLAGGFLFADDDYGMDKTFREEMKKVFPDKELIELPHNHDIYHVIYGFPKGPPKIHEHDGKPARGYGIIDKGRVLVFYTHETDIGDGLEDAEVHNDPPEKRETALRMAINIVAYALTH